MLGAYYSSSALAPVTDMNWDEKPAVRTHPSNIAPAITSISQYLPTSGLGQMSLLREYQGGSLGSLLREWKAGSLGYSHVAPSPTRFGTEVAGLGKAMTFGTQVAGYGAYSPYGVQVAGLGTCPCNGVGNVVTDKWAAMTTTQKALAVGGVALLGLFAVGMFAGKKKRR